MEGQISFNDAQDVYVVKLAKAQKVTFNLSSYFRSLNIELVDSNGKTVMKERVTGGESNTPEKWNTTETLEAGTYYVKINDSWYHDTGLYSFGLMTNLNFSDVKIGDFYYNQLAELYFRNIIHGYPDGTFKPYQKLLRQHAIVLLYNALDLEAPSNYKEIANKFSDVGENHQYAKQVAALYEEGIFHGKPNGKMGLNDNLTREQMATVLVNAFKLKDTGNDIDVYLDNVSESHKNNVYILAQYNVTNQLDNFRPQESVTRSQFVVFLHKVL
ncbi:S-layer homology domain-containing protein [Virgibacillus sp. FSP13]